jgi:hypothetical protein
VCFPFFPSRDGDQVRAVLGADHAPDAMLLTDGYAAYQSYAKKVGLTHAQCWAHSRRNFFESQALEPDAVDALKQIGALYAIEEEIRGRKLTGESKRLHRFAYGKPRVDAFFDRVNRQFERQGLLPSNPFTQTLGYVRERRTSAGPSSAPSKSGSCKVSSSPVACTVSIPTITWSTCFSESASTRRRASPNSPRAGGNANSSPFGRTCTLSQGRLARRLPFTAHRSWQSLNSIVTHSQKKDSPMHMSDIPFCITDWSQIERTEHKGENGFAYWRTQHFGGLRVRAVEYTPGYVADHWCVKGHILLCTEGELITELKDGRKFTLVQGMSYQVADNAEPHRSHTVVGAKLFIVD